MLRKIKAGATVLVTAPVMSATAFAHPAMEHNTYATCYNLRGTMANGRYVHKRAAASNYLRLGTRVRITSRHPGPGGIRKYIISDRGGSPLNDGHLDLWHPTCSGWPNPRITFKFGWRRHG